MTIFIVFANMLPDVHLLPATLDYQIQTKSAVMIAHPENIFYSWPKCWQLFSAKPLSCGQDEDKPAASPHLLWKLPSPPSSPSPSSAFPLPLSSPDKPPNSASLSQELPAIGCFPGQTNICEQHPELYPQNFEKYPPPEFLWYQSHHTSIMKNYNCVIARRGDLPIWTVHWLGAAIERFKTFIKASLKFTKSDQQNPPNNSVFKYIRSKLFEYIRIMNYSLNSAPELAVDCGLWLLKRNWCRWRGYAGAMVTSWLLVGRLLWRTLASHLSTLCLVLSRLLLLLLLFHFVSESGIVKIVIVIIVICILHIWLILILRRGWDLDSAHPCHQCCRQWGIWMSGLIIS